MPPLSYREAADKKWAAATICRETDPRQSLETEGRNILADAPRLGAKLPPL